MRLQPSSHRAIATSVPQARSGGVFRAIAATTAALLGFVIAIVGVTPAHADTLTSENFSSGLGSWTPTLGMWSASGGHALAGGGIGGDTLSRTVNTTGYQSITVSFDYYVDAIGGADFFLFNYSTNGGLTQQNTPIVTTDTGGWVPASYSLVLAANNNPNLLVRFNALEISGSDIRVDNIVISGDPIPTDTTAPTVVAINPDPGDSVPTTVTEYWSNVNDNATPRPDLDVTYTFTSVANPALVFTTALLLPDPTGAVRYNGTGTVIASTLALVAGDQFTWRIDVSDSAGNSNSTSVTVFYITDSPTPVAPSITSGAPADGLVDVAYTHTVVADGTPTVSFAVTTGSLPPGLTLDSATGVIDGVPTTEGSWTFEITASNATAPDDAESYSIDIAEAPMITWAGPADGTVGVAVTDTITASGTVPMSFAVTAGALPVGLALSTGGELTGVPTTAETANFTVTASNSTGIDDVQPFTMVVQPAPASPLITSLAPNDGTVGVAYTFAVTASGFPAPAFTVTIGTLPDGLTLDAASGVIEGTPTTLGMSTFTITASNAEGSDDVEYEIDILPVPVAPVITSASPAGGTVGVGYFHTFTASGTPAATFTVTSGALPAGIIVSGASLTGNPTTVGSSTFEITASNGTSPDSTQTYVVEIVAAPIAPTISGAPAPATVGVPYDFVPTIGGTGPLSVALTSGDLPLGLILDALTGEISGNPADTADSYPIELTVTGVTGPDAVLSVRIELAAGEPVDVQEVRAGLQWAGEGGTLTVDEGGSLTFSVVGVDLGGNLLDLTSDVVFVSDVPTDVVAGSTVSFPTASPHVITATHVPSSLTLTFTVEVVAAAVEPAAPPLLASTGTTLGAEFLFGFVLLVFGACLRWAHVTRGGRLGRGERV